MSEEERWVLLQVTTYDNGQKCKKCFQYQIRNSQGPNPYLCDVAGKMKGIGACNIINNERPEACQQAELPLTVGMIEHLIKKHKPNKNLQGYRVYKNPEHKKMVIALEKTKQIMEGW